MPDFYLNSYAPLVASKLGRCAAQEYDIPPFVDGSIRREPDLEHQYPGISCLCRGEKFAPRLRDGDTVAYMTKKGRYGTKSSERRLTAVLLVAHRFSSHAAAATWYRSQNLPLPNNCIVPGNDHMPLDQSHRRHKDRAVLDDERLCRRWDGQYRLRAARHGTFVVCHVLFCDLTWDAPTVCDDDLVTAFDRIPGTRNPGTVPEDEFRFFLDLLDISAVPSCQ